MLALTPPTLVSNHKLAHGNVKLASPQTKVFISGLIFSENKMLIKEANMGIDRGNLGIDRVCEQCSNVGVLSMSIWVSNFDFSVLLIFEYI